MAGEYEFAGTVDTGEAGVTSFNSRNGDVLPEPNDYAAADVTNAADTSSADLQTFSGPIAFAEDVGFYGTSPVAQPTAAGNTTYTPAGVIPVDTAGTFTGGIGSTGYTVGDVVKALKTLGLIAE